MSFSSNRNGKKASLSLIVESQENLEPSTSSLGKLNIVDNISPGQSQHTGSTASSIDSTTPPASPEKRNQIPPPPTLTKSVSFKDTLNPPLLRNSSSPSSYQATAQPTSPPARLYNSPNTVTMAEPGIIQPSKSRRKKKRSNSDIPASVVGGFMPPQPTTPVTSGAAPAASTINYAYYGPYGPSALVYPYPVAAPGTSNYAIPPRRVSGTQSWGRGNVDRKMPPLPFRPEERKPLVDEANKVRKSRREGRKKALSSSATSSNYGAFWNGDVTDAPASMHESSSPSNRFSPRAEFRKLAQGMSPTSPSLRKIPAFSPTLAQSALLTGTHSLRLDPGDISSFRQHRHRNESHRKMHMRQQSAQLFMEEAKGVEQELKCRNVLFLLLFIFHLIFIGYLGSIFGPEALQSHEQNPLEVTIVYENLVWIALYAGAFAMGLSAIMLFSISLLARYFVQMALIIAITLSFMWGTIGVGWSPKTLVPISGIIALGLAVAYTFIVWDRIPFASANLVTAISGIRAYPGIVLLAFGFQALALAWSIYYTVVVVGIYDRIQETKSWELSKQMATFIYILLGVSFVWTFQVLQYTVQAISAGVIAGWWYQPNDGTHVRTVSVKTLFYSMGSICFGALFVGPVGILKQLSVLFRPSSNDNTSLMCLHECIHCIQSCVSSFVDTLAATFNSWAFSYIGLYHYGFLDAGYNATDLFEKRGWTTIVSDDLVPNVLLLSSFVIGGITGCFAHLISQLDRLTVVPRAEPGVVPFVEGAVIGLVLTNIFFSIIKGAVDAVLICFASSPLDFERNHPELSHEMRSSWREVWPGALDVCDLRLALESVGSFASAANSTPSTSRHYRSGSFEQHPLL